MAYLSFWARDWGGRFLFAMVSCRGIMPRMCVRLLWKFMNVGPRTRIPIWNDVGCGGE